MFLVSIGTSPYSMQATLVKLDIGFGFIIIHRPAQPLDWQPHVCSDYNIFSVRDANENLLSFSVVVLYLRFGSTMYKTIFLVVDYFSRKLILAAIDL